MSNIFHYAFKVKDLASTRDFYIKILGCTEGRSTDSWVDFDLYGNQLSAHVGVVDKKLDYCGNVDGVSVPIPHFGCVLKSVEFSELSERLEKEKINFIIEPQVRYEGKSGQQKIMFVLDYSGNPLEFKSFEDNSELFKA
jgi:extradiol dioxygenase family protein